MLDTDCLYYLSQLVGAIACSKGELDGEVVDDDRRLEVVRSLEVKVAAEGVHDSIAREFLTETAGIDGLSTQDSEQHDLRANIYSNPLFNFCIDRLTHDRELWRNGDIAKGTDKRVLNNDVESVHGSVTPMHKSSIVLSKSRLLMDDTAGLNGSTIAPKYSADFSTEEMTTPMLRLRGRQSSPAADEDHVNTEHSLFASGAKRRTNMDPTERKLRRENLQLHRDLKSKSLICHDLRLQLSQLHQIFDHLLTAVDDESETVPGFLVALIKGEILFSTAIKKVVEKVILMKCEVRDLKRQTANVAMPRPVMTRQHSEYASQRRFRGSTGPPSSQNDFGRNFFSEKELYKSPLSPQGKNHRDPLAARYSANRPQNMPSPIGHAHCLDVNENEAFMRGYLGLGRTELELPDDEVQDESAAMSMSYRPRGLNEWHSGGASLLTSSSVAARNSLLLNHHHRAESSTINHHYRSATTLHGPSPLSVGSLGSETVRSNKKGSGKILHAISKFLNGGTIRKNPSFIV